MQKYNKLIVAIVAGIIATLSSLYGVNGEIVTILISVATAFGVYKVPNVEDE